MKQLNRLTSFALALCLTLALTVSAFAATGNLTTEGGTASTTVSVRVNGPTFDVQVPTSVTLALSVGSDGENYLANVVTPSNIAIQNYSTLPVEVKSFTVSNDNHGNAWTLRSYSEDFTSLAKNTKTYGFSINGSPVTGTGEANKVVIDSSDSEAAWHRIGALSGNTPGTLPLTFDAKFGTWTRDCASTQAATVAFVIGWPESLS